MGDFLKYTKVDIMSSKAININTSLNPSLVAKADTIGILDSTP